MKKIFSVAISAMLILSVLTGCKGVAVDESKSIIAYVDKKFETVNSDFDRLEKSGLPSTDFKIQLDNIKSEYANLKSKVEAGDTAAIVEITSSLKSCEEKLDALDKKIIESIEENEE